MSKPFITSETKVIDVLEYGQGDDGNIAEIFKAFKQFRDGYYELVNWGDDWWKVFNQDTMFDEMMAEQWNEIEKIDFMSVIEKMAKAMIGTYVRFDSFAETVILASEAGKGYQPNRAEQEKQDETD